MTYPPNSYYVYSSRVARKSSMKGLITAFLILVDRNALLCFQAQSVELGVSLSTFLQAIASG